MKPTNTVHLLRSLYMLFFFFTVFRNFYLNVKKLKQIGFDKLRKQLNYKETVLLKTENKKMLYIYLGHHLVKLFKWIWRPYQLFSIRLYYTNRCFLNTKELTIEVFTESSSWKFNTTRNQKFKGKALLDNCRVTFTKKLWRCLIGIKENE